MDEEGDRISSGGSPDETAGAARGRGGAEGGEDLAAHLARVLYPAEQQQIMETVRRNGAPPEILEQLEKLPAGQAFDSSEEAWEALGG